MHAVAITGSYEWTNAELVRKYIEALPKKSIVITGDSIGVELWADAYANDYGHQSIIIPKPLGEKTVTTKDKNKIAIELLKGLHKADHSVEIIVFYYPGNKRSLVYDLYARGKRAMLPSQLVT